MLKIERKYKIFFLHDNYTLKLFFMMDMKPIVSSLEKLCSRSDPDDAIVIKLLVSLLMYLAYRLHFMLITKHMLEYL